MKKISKKIGALLMATILAVSCVIRYTTAALFDPLRGVVYAQNSIFTKAAFLPENELAPEQVHPQGYVYYCYVDSTIIQEQKTWCGVASTLMALTGIEEYSKSSLISTYTRPSQKTVAASVIPAGEDTAFVYAIVDYLNSKLTKGKYDYTKVDNAVNQTEVEKIIKYSLSADRPIIINCSPYKAFGYYENSNYSGRHYVVIEAYDVGAKMCTVSDCTYLGSKYQGRHYDVSLSEIYNSLYCPNNDVYVGYMIHAKMS